MMLYVEAIYIYSYTSHAVHVTWLNFKQQFLFGVPPQTSSFLHYGLTYQSVYFLSTMES